MAVTLLCILINGLPYIIQCSISSLLFLIVSLSSRNHYPITSTAEKVLFNCLGIRKYSYVVANTSVVVCMDGCHGDCCWEKPQTLQRLGWSQFCDDGFREGFMDTKILCVPPPPQLLPCQGHQSSEILASPLFFLQGGGALFEKVYKIHFLAILIMSVQISPWLVEGWAKALWDFALKSVQSNGSWPH